MNTTEIVKSKVSTSSLTLFCRQQVHRLLDRLQWGQIVIRDELGEACYGQGPGSVTGVVVILDLHAYRDIAFGGSIGAGEAYMTGDWSTPDLTTLVRILVRNMDVLDSMERGLASLMLPLQKLFHRANQNTERGSRRNIAAHYDLGNAFFQTFLDPTMMYSSAIYPDDGASLYEASIYKLDRICKKLDLQPHDHLLEIGTGWGAMAIHAAKHYGCKVTTTTISRQQYEYAAERIQEEGLEDRIELLFEDYRRLSGKYDKLVSIEMIEAVGHEYFPEYFRQCSQLLKSNGLMLIQAITIADQRYDYARRNVDFIQRYIFPGGSLPSVTVLNSVSTQVSDLRVFHQEDITPHYAKTLADWRAAFVAELPRVRAMGYDETFINMWRFYLSYCEGGFLERAIGCVQMVFAKPENRHASILGSL